MGPAIAKSALKDFKRWLSVRKRTMASTDDPPASITGASPRLYLTLPTAPREFGLELVESNIMPADSGKGKQRLPESGQQLQKFGNEALLQSQSGLFRLPAEIRIQIYEAMATTYFEKDRLPAGHQLSGANLLLTCKQAYYEAQRIVYKRSTVYAMHTMRVNFYRHLSDSLLRTVETIFLTEAAVALEKWSKYHAWRNRTYDCVQRRLCEAHFHPKTMIFVSNFSRYDCFELEHLDPNMHRSQFHTAMTDFHLALSIITTVTAVHFVDLNGGVTRSRFPWPGCFHCRHPTTLPRPNPGEVYHKPSAAEMFEREYELEPGVPGVISYDRYRVDGRFKAVRSDTDECVFWLSVNKKEPRTIRVQVHDGWQAFCCAWQGPFLASSCDTESVGPP